MTTAIVIVSSTEGIGKSSLAKVVETLLGRQLVTYPSPTSLSRFNFQLYGKVLVVLEETEALQKFDGGLNDVLKNLVTNDVFSYEAKGIQPKDLKNINSFIITSNFSLSTAGRRYINITPSTKWLNRDDFFEQLYDLDDENIKALYDFLLSVDTQGFNEEKEGKKLSSECGNLKEIEKMNNVFRFIKDNYALDKQSEKLKKCDLYDKYKASGVQKPYNKSSFYDKISELNINSVKTCGYDYYVINGEEIFNEFKKRNLIHSEDVVKENENKNKNVDDEVNKKLIDENKELKLQLEEMRKEIELLKQAKVIVPETKVINAPETKVIEEKVTNDSNKKIIKVKAFTIKK